MAKPIYFFISPHLDDVILSCGGYVRRLTAEGKRVIIATVATANAPAGSTLSRLVQRNHMAWRLGNAPFSVRRREDAAAAESLDAEYVHLDLLDAMYRLDGHGKPLYTKNTVRVPVHPDDWRDYELTVRRGLKATIQDLGDEVRVICPLAVGEHVDHIVVRQAVEALFEGQCFHYYEDYPYANQPAAVQARLNLDGGLANWQSVTIGLTPEEIQARITAVACCASQVPGLFPSELERWQEIARARLPIIGPYLDWPPDVRASRARMASSLRAYISRVGGERYWYRCEERTQSTEHQFEKVQ